MSLDVFHLIPQSQVIDMTGGRFGNMAFVVFVTREIWNSNRSPRATATRFHQFRQQDTREHTYLQANPNWRRVSKERHARPEVEGYWGQGRTHPGISRTQNAPPGSYIDTRIVIMQQVIHLAKEVSELSF